MNSKDYVELFYKEKNNMLKIYFRNPDISQIGLKIKNLNLNSAKISELQNIIDEVISETMYSILLGLDGEASIGGVQQMYKLYDESGCCLTDSGEIEQYAYEYFQEDK